MDNSTGWPWYAANLPPGDFYDCLFIYFSCTDFEQPGEIVNVNILNLVSLCLNIVCSAWPDNKEKCTQLFDYCITYVENDSQEKGPFVTKVRTICIDNK